MMDKETTGIDYGFRLIGRPVLLYKDRSLAADETTHQMEKALRQMSMEYYALDRCLQCGICSSFCPYYLLQTDDPFSPRSFIQKTRLGLLDLSSEEIWQCTNCGHCQMVCPFEIPFLDVMASLRNLVIEQGAGHMPLSIKTSLASIATCGNPWKEDAGGRVNWIQHVDGRADEGCDNETVHLFLGCMSGYDRRARKAAESAMRILRAAGIPFIILAEQEVCCGDTVRRVGDFAAAAKVQAINKSTFEQHHVKKLCVLSPHCLETFRHLYEQNAEDTIQVSPLVELVYDLIRQGTVKLTPYAKQKATFHDPCFFSKHNNIIDQPREILNAMPGIELAEMAHAGKNSLCCGGGGGGIWRDTRKGERLSEIRLDEALDTGAQMLVTCCPYCVSMLEDAKQGDGKYQALEVVDLFELIGKGMCHEDH